MLTGRERLSAYVDCDAFCEATTTQSGDDDDHHHHHHPQQQQQQQLLLSTSRLYDRAGAPADADVIDQVMQCNEPTQR